MSVAYPARWAKTWEGGGPQKLIVKDKGYTFLHQLYTGDNLSELDF